MPFLYIQLHSTGLRLSRLVLLSTPKLQAQLERTRTCVLVIIIIATSGSSKVSGLPAMTSISSTAFSINPTIPTVLFSMTTMIPLSIQHSRPSSILTGLKLPLLMISSPINGQSTAHATFPSFRPSTVQTSAKKLRFSNHISARQFKSQNNSS